MCEVKNELCPKNMLNLFQEVTQSYNIGKSLIFGSYQIKTARYGTKTIAYLGPKIWSIVPEEIIESTSLETFRQNIKLKPSSCPRLFTLQMLNLLMFREILQVGLL